MPRTKVERAGGEAALMAATSVVTPRAAFQRATCSASAAMLLEKAIAPTTARHPMLAGQSMNPWVRRWSLMRRGSVGRSNERKPSGGGP